MNRAARFFALVFTLCAALLASPARAEMRFALVIGNAAYPQRPLATTLNDAGLIAETLRTAGFDVTEGADADLKTLTGRAEEFLAKVAQAGPQAVAFVYLSGYGVQADCDNFYVPVDARLTESRNLAAETLRISDLVRALSELPAKARVVVLDAARDHPFRALGQAKGFSVFEAPSGALVAFNAAPGMTANDASSPYGAYAPALSEILRIPGLSLDQVFPRGRLRVEYETGGKQYPWNDSALGEKVVLFERDGQTPAPETTYLEEKRNASLRSLPADEAYFIAVERDTVKAYEEFLRAHGASPLAQRIRAMLSLRREGVAWCRARSVNTPEAYWTYVKRHPKGRYVPEARVELLELAAPMEPPPAFTEVWWEDMPPESLVPYEEVIVVEDSWHLLPPAPPLLAILPALPLIPAIYLASRPPAPPPLIAPGLLPKMPVVLAPGGKLAVAPPLLPLAGAPRPVVKLPLAGAVKAPPLTLPNQKPWWQSPPRQAAPLVRPSAGLVPQIAPVQPGALPRPQVQPPAGAILPRGLPRPGQIPPGGIIQPPAQAGAVQPPAGPGRLQPLQQQVVPGQGSAGSRPGLRPQIQSGPGSLAPPRAGSQPRLGTPQRPGLPPRAAGVPPPPPGVPVPRIRGRDVIDGPRGPVIQPRGQVPQTRPPVAPRIAAPPPPQFRPPPGPRLSAPPPQFRPPPQIRSAPPPQVRAAPPPQVRAAPPPQFRPPPQFSAPRPQAAPVQQSQPSRRCGGPGLPPCR